MSLNGIRCSNKIHKPRSKKNQTDHCSEKIKAIFDTEMFNFTEQYYTYINKLQKYEDFSIILQLKSTERDELERELQKINTIITSSSFRINGDVVFFDKTMRHLPQAINESRMRNILKNNYNIIFYIKENIISIMIIKSCVLNLKISNILKTYILNSTNFYANDNVFRYVCSGIDEFKYILDNHYCRIINSLNTVNYDVFSERIKRYLLNYEMNLNKSKIKKSKIIKI